MNRVKDLIHWDTKYLAKSEDYNFSIAILDTGIALHPDLQKQIIYFKDWIKQKEYPYDDNGHGTHVAGCISGTGEVSKRKYSGVIPGIFLVIHKILDKNGDGQLEILQQSLLWILDNYETYHIKIINISVGLNLQIENPLLDEILSLMKMLWEKNIIIVCAAGNNGPDIGTISRLAESEYCITVGCYDPYVITKKRACQTYSSRGNPYHTIVKPDLVAPGTEVMSCNSKFLSWHGKYYNAYTRRGGTSMSTPIVAGTLAMAISIKPQVLNDLDAKQLKYILCKSCEDLHKAYYMQGTGMLNVQTFIETMENFLGESENN